MFCFLFVNFQMNKKKTQVSKYPQIKVVFSFSLKNHKEKKNINQFPSYTHTRENNNKKKTFRDGIKIYEKSLSSFNFKGIN